MSPSCERPREEHRRVPSKRSSKPRVGQTHSLERRPSRGAWLLRLVDQKRKHSRRTESTSPQQARLGPLLCRGLTRPRELELQPEVSSDQESHVGQHQLKHLPTHACIPSAGCSGISPTANGEEGRPLI